MMQIKTGFCIVLTLFLWSSWAMAQPLELYAVKNVASIDRLNVCSSVDAGSHDIGDIAYDGQVSVIGFNDDGKWAKIPWGGSTGWVSMRFLRLVQAKLKAIPVTLQCGGTEPFWLADVSQDAVLFQMMAGPQTTAPMDWAVPAAGRPADYIVGFGAGPFTGVLHSEICSDGMSDKDYLWSIVLINHAGSGQRVVEGCCNY